MTRATRPATVATLLGLLLLAGCSGPAATPSGERSTPLASARASSDPATPSVRPSASPASPDPTPAPLTWSQLDASGPSAREDHTWTLDGSGTTAFLFGGRSGASAMGDLWAYDLDTDRWSEIDAVDGPAPRFGHEAVWVDDIGVVVFAGQAGPTFFNDLWAFDPETGAWRQLPAGGDVPVSRYGTCAAIGPDGRLWISHGFTSDGTRFADTKAYDFAGGTWTDETPSGDLPVNRCLHGCWWTADGELTLFGGQTTGVTALDDRWSLRPGEAWSRIDGTAPTPRNLYARARLEGASLLFGGQGLDGARLDDAWLMIDGRGDAIPLDVAGAAPAGRSGAELIGDARGGRILLFGGLGVGGALADTWELSGDLPDDR
jgi:hypothetical protein